MSPLRSVLLVEDDAAVARAMARPLKIHAPVTIAGCVAQALAALADKTPSHIIVDVKLPDGSGFDVIARARAMIPSPSAVLVTGDSTFVNPAAAADVRLFLKPVDCAWLVDFVTKESHDNEGDLAGALNEWTRCYALTPSERRILAAAARHVPRNEIADTLRRADNTIKTHVRHLLAKTGHRRLNDAVLALLSGRAPHSES